MHGAGICKLSVGAGAITGRFEGATLRVWANDELFEFDERSYGFPVPTATRNGRVFVPLRTLGEVLEHSIRYDQAKKQISLIKHGFGQDGEIREKLEAFFNGEGSVEDLFTMDYPDRIYWEDSSDLRKLPRRSYDFWMGDITYPTAREAVVSAGYRSETQTLKSSVETKFTLRLEGGTWKITDRKWVHFTLDLPADADETAGRLSSENASETQKIVSDLKKHYEAMNGRKLEAAKATFSPYFIEE
ncbi:stalk domain-containing protein [Cohnella mopanensis]|uniref:stalk domain-containing protein n=1 Tax=Cohnella mopanensis TaxID=2911966 RepID=UPI001EF83E48|nr:stalk domain-containing protein [Cohnella mopanensis]